MALNLTTPFIATRTVLISVLMFLGIVGNGFVLWFYGKNKKLTGQVYILALAVIDLVACVVILPHHPVFEREEAPERWTVLYPSIGLLTVLQSVSYFGVQVTMALDQFIAVFWPFRHARLQRKLNRVMLGVCSGFAVLMMGVRIFMLILKIVKIWFSVLYLVMGLSSVLTLIILYPATAYKLYRLNAIVRPQPQIRLQNMRTTFKCNDHGKPGPKVKHAQMHVQALKIYTAILLQFMLSTLLCTVGWVIFHERWMVYFFWINHVGNPVIYYCFV